MSTPPIPSTSYQLFVTVLSLPRAYHFTLKHRLWQGLAGYGWLSRILAVCGLVSGLYFLSEVFDWWDRADLHAPTQAFLSVGTLTGRLALDGYESFTSGGLKYLVLILFEVVVFHFMRTTMAIKTGITGGTEFKDFWAAQKRMIAITIRCYVLEIIASVLIGIVIGFIGVVDFLETPLKVAVQCGLVGYAIVDNYAEQYGFSVDQSAKWCRQYAGVIAVLGVVLYLLLLIPVIGTVGGPLLVAVAAALVLTDISPLHRLDPAALLAYRATFGEEIPEDETKEEKRARKERRRADKRLKKRS